MPKYSQTEKEFIELLATKPDNVGDSTLSNFDYATFSSGLKLYLQLVASNERSRKTSSAHGYAAQSCNVYLLEAQKLAPEKRPHYLYKNLLELLKQGDIQPTGWDGKESQLYQLIEGYLQWYYDRVIVAGATPSNLAAELDAYATADLADGDKAAISALRLHLAPFLPPALPPRQSSPVQTVMHRALSNAPINPSLTASVRDEAVRRAYRSAKNVVSRIKNPLLQQKIAAFIKHYHLALAHYSYSQSGLIPQLNAQLEKIREEFNQELTQTVQQKNSEIREYQEKIQVQEQQLKNTLQQQNGTAQQLRDLTADKRALSAKVSVLELEIAADLKLLEKTELQLGEAQARQQQTQAQLADAERAKTSLQTTLQKEIEVLKGELNNERQQVEQIQQSHVSVKDFRQIQQSAATETAYLQKALLEEKRKTELFEDVFRERNDYLAQTELLAATIAALKAENAQLAEAKEENTALKATHQQLSQTNNDLLNENFRLQAETAKNNQALLDKVERLASENQQQQSLLDTLKSFLLVLLGILNIKRFSECTTFTEADQPLAQAADKFLAIKDSSEEISDEFSLSSLSLSSDSDEEETDFESEEVDSEISSNTITVTPEQRDEEERAVCLEKISPELLEEKRNKEQLNFKIAELPAVVNPTAFPTKPPLADALPMMQSLMSADTDTQQRLLAEYPLQISGLILKLIGKATTSLLDYDSISMALMAFANKVGKEAIDALNLPKGLIQRAQEELLKQLFKGVSEAVAKERFNRLRLYGSPYHVYIKNRLAPKLPPRPAPITAPQPSLLDSFLGFFANGEQKPVAEKNELQVSTPTVEIKA